MGISPALNAILRKTGLTDEQLRRAGVSVLGEQPPRPSGRVSRHGDSPASAPAPKTEPLKAVTPASAISHQPAGAPAASQDTQHTTQLPATRPVESVGHGERPAAIETAQVGRRSPATPGTAPLAPAKRPTVPKPSPISWSEIGKPDVHKENVILTATGAEILDWTVGFLKRFVSLSTEQARAVALWVVHTHAMAAADCTPYLAINSAEKQSGKTRLLEVLRLLVLAAWFTGRVTAAVLSRKIDAVCPTLLLDESDAAFNGDETYAEVLRGVLNSGYRRGGCVSVCTGKGAEISYSDFSTFCAKAIAGLGKLPDTVADRSIPIRLKRAQRGSVERFREREEEQETQPWKTQIAAWCEAHIEELRQARPDIPGALSDRQADVCEPLLAIADAVGGEWPQAARTALLELCVGAQADDGSIGVRLLRDIKEVFGKKPEMASAGLCEALALIETSPWAEWHRGKRLSPMGLSRLLKPFEVYPAPLSSGQSRGYRITQFDESFRLYLPLQGVKVSESQYPCGSEANFKVSNGIPSDTLKNAVSANNDAGPRHLDTLKPEIQAQESDEPEHGDAWEPPEEERFEL
jgi:hypothetical protein